MDVRWTRTAVLVSDCRMCAGKNCSNTEVEALEVIRIRMNGSGMYKNGLLIFLSNEILLA